MLPVLGLLGLLAACGREDSRQPGPSGGGMPPAEVSVITVEPRRLPVSFEYAAQTAGYRDVEVRARVSGIIQRRLFLEGGMVRAGQPLFQIEAAGFEAALARAEADRAQAEARLAQAEADLARLQKDAARLKPLFEARAVSQKEYDDAAAGEQAARAAAQAARAAIQAAQAAIVQARLDLDYTRVQSPIGGLIGRALKSEGSLVSAAEATLLTTVTQVDPIYVLFGVGEGEWLKLQREAAEGRLSLPRANHWRVQVQLADGSLYEHYGEVDFSDNRVNPATGTTEGRATLPNPRGRLRPGQFVRVILNGAEYPDALLVPQRAVLDGPHGKFVYVVSAQSVAEPRPVEVGDWSGEQWIIRSGLKPGERVIVDGALKVMPGAPVQVAEPGQTSPSAPGTGQR